jgi:hypothetical protein
LRIDGAHRVGQPPRRPQPASTPVTVRSRSAGSPQSVRYRRHPPARAARAPLHNVEQLGRRVTPATSRSPPCSTRSACPGRSRAWCSGPTSRATARRGDAPALAAHHRPLRQGAAPRSGSWSGPAAGRRRSRRCRRCVFDEQSMMADDDRPRAPPPAWHRADRRWPRSTPARRGPVAAHRRPWRDTSIRRRAAIASPATHTRVADRASADATNRCASSRRLPRRASACVRGPRSPDASSFVYRCWSRTGS